MSEGPAFSTRQILRKHSLARRITHVAAGLAGLGVAAVVGLLWATEPAVLPWRTQASFAVLMVIGLGWAGVAAVALIRRPWFAIDRVLAARLAVVFGALLTVGLVVLAQVRGSRAGWLAAALLGAALTAIAGIALRRAAAYRDRLRGLEHHLTEKETP
jgi:hypothetical protein